jgi:hypothetical protein
MFSKSNKSLLKGIVVRDAGHKRIKLKAKIHDDVLTITLPEPIRMGQFSVSAPAMTVTPSLAENVKRHSIKSLSLAITVTDTTHTTTRLTLRPKAS